MRQAHSSGHTGGRVRVQLSCSPLWAWVSTILAPTHLQPPKAHLVLKLPVPSCGSDITKQHAVLELNPGVALGMWMTQPGGRSLNTFWLCHCSLWTLVMSCPFPLGSGFAPVNRDALDCGMVGSSLFSFGLKSTSSRRHFLPMVIQTALFPSRQLLFLQNSILLS